MKIEHKKQSNQDISKHTIFVAVTGFDENLMGSTISSAIENAEYSERVFFGVNNVSSNGCFQNIIQPIKNIKVIYSVVGQPRGWGIDRCSADSFWNGEDFYLQIDGHMIFEKFWDSYLISDWIKINKDFDVEKPIISNHAPQWYFGDDGQIMGYEKDSTQCCPIYIQTIGEIHKNWSEPALIVDGDRRVCGDEIMEHYVICGHFMFASSMWLQEIGHDPKAMFIGDQSMIALRSITRGYKVFSTGRTYVWHLSKHLSKKQEQQGEWRELIDRQYGVNNYVKKSEMERIRQYLTGEKFDHYGAPNKDSLDKYQVMIGLNFKHIYKLVDDMKDSQ